MAVAYTPGLKVRAHEIIREVRRLPLKGEVTVDVGDVVQPHDIVAKTEIPGDPASINISQLLTVEPYELPDVVTVEVGDEVKKGDVIARKISFFGLFKSEQMSPVDGVVEMISEVSGQMVLREPPTPLNVEAYVEGVVREILPDEGVIIETAGAFIQGIFGIGGERRGVIKILASAPDETISPSLIDESCEGKILVIGNLATAEMLRRGEEFGAVGLISGGIVDADLIDYLGYDIGVAITGHEDIPLTLIITEGFGPMRMADKTFDLLRELEGREVSLNGATQIRAGVMRPEIISTDPELLQELIDKPQKAEEDIEDENEDEDLAGGLELGTPIRIIREPYFGELAEVTGLPPELQVVESETHVRVLNAKLQDGTEVTIPRANVEIIES
ncbi:MAG: hypothetical protein ACOCVQ_00935 [Bacillota bacterium]